MIKPRRSRTTRPSQRFFETLEYRCLLAADVSFAAPVVTSNTSYNYSLGAADFNKDGKLDLALAHVSSLVVRFGDGNGSFAADVAYPADSFPDRVTVADFNGDTWPDIAATNNSNKVSILLNNGNGTFAAPVNYDAHSSSTLDIINTGDLNNDGKPDLLLTYSDSNRISYFINNGSGFNTRVDIASTQSFGCQWIETADLNADGKKDLVAVGPLGVDVLLQTGTLSFPSRANYFYSNGFSDVVVADFDGDNKPDIAALGMGHNGVSVLTNTGGGGFIQIPQIYATTSRVPLLTQGLAAADFSGDGKVDLAVLDDDSVRILVSGVSGFDYIDTTAFALAINPNTDNASAITVGDFNGDAQPDIVVATNGSSVLNVFLNDRTSAVNHVPTVSDNYSHKPVIQNTPTAFTLSDFTGEFNDMENGALIKIKITELPINGTLKLAGVPVTLNQEIPREQLSTLTYINTAPTLLDDSFRWTGADASAYATFPATFRLHGIYGAYNRYNGMLRSTLNSPASELTTIGNFDDFGTDDMAVIDPYTPKLTIRYSNAGVFDPFYTTIINLPYVPSKIVSLDVNGDGALDLAITYVENNNYSIFLNNGNGYFSTRQDFDPTTGDFDLVGLAAGDISGDGWDDLVFTYHDTNANTDKMLVRYNNNGTFGSGQLFTITDTAQHIKIADYNGDQLNDIIADTGSVKLYPGRIEGGVSSTATTLSNSGMFVIADLNGDAKLDLAVDNGGVRIILNGGSNTLYNNFTTSDFAVGDINRDGFPDLVLSRTNILFNDGHGAFTSPPAPDIGFYNGSIALVAFIGNDKFPDLIVDDGDKIAVFPNALGTIQTQTKLVFQGAPIGYLNQPTTVRVSATNDFGHIITTTKSISLSIAQGPFGGVITGVTVNQTIAGVAEFYVNFSKEGTYKLTASADGLTSATSGNMVISIAPIAKIKFDQQPTSAAVNATLSPLVVSLRDMFGHPFAGITTGVTMSIAAASQAELTGTKTVGLVNGIATFNDLKLTTPGNYILRAAYNALNTVTQTITVAPNTSPVAALSPIAPASGDIAVNYKLTDAESEDCSVVIEYSADGATWHAATAAAGDGVSGLTATPAGIDHVFVWDSRADLGDTLANVQIRITPNDGGSSGVPAVSAAFAVDNRLLDLALTLGVITPAYPAFLPGEKFTLPVTLTNMGLLPAAASAASPVFIEIRRSPDGQFHAGDPLWATIKLTAPLAAGATRILKTSITIPAGAEPGTLFAAAMADTTGKLTEANTANNAASAVVDVEWHFGNIPGRVAAAPLTLTDADGTTVKFTLTGPGSVQLDNAGGEYSVTLADTTPASSLKITTTKSKTPGDDGRFTLHSLIAPTALKKITALTTTLTGDLTVNGALGGLSLYAIDGGPGSTLTISGRLNALTVKSHVAHATLTADSLGAAAITGNLDNAALLLSQIVDPKIKALSSLKAAQIISSQIRAVGNIGSITAVSLDHAVIFAGVNDGVATLPASAADFITADPAALPTIASLKLKGLAAEPDGAVFTDSLVAAGRIATVTLPKRDSAIADTDPAAAPFGFAVRILGKSTGPLSAGDYTNPLNALL